MPKKHLRGHASSFPQKTKHRSNERNFKPPSSGIRTAAIDGTPNGGTTGVVDSQGNKFQVYSDFQGTLDEWMYYKNRCKVKEVNDSCPAPALVKDTGVKGCLPSHGGGRGSVTKVLSLLGASLPNYANKNSRVIINYCSGIIPPTPSFDNTTNCLRQLTDDICSAYPPQSWPVAATIWLSVAGGVGILAGLLYWKREQVKSACRRSSYSTIVEIIDQDEPAAESHVDIYLPNPVADTEPTPSGPLLPRAKP